jgi:uncharacterized protein (TIGR02147 family)
MFLLHTFKDYKSVIRAQIRANARQKGYKSKLAKVAGVHASYLTQVLQDKAHFTPDQASLLADFWGLSGVEYEFFLTLVHLQRAAHRQYREKLEKKLAELRRALLRQEDAFQTTDQSRDAIRYYSHWLCSAIQMLLLVPSLRTTKELAAHLEVSPQEVSRQLQALAEIGFVVKAGDQWLPTKKTIHSTFQSSLTALHHQNWRQRSVECIKSGKPGLNYTSVYCLGEKDMGEIREKLQALIAEIDKIALASPEETGACLVLDWFRI